jgi:hypothetical protein
VRDILSQRWINTEQTYEHENPKRVCRQGAAGRTSHKLPIVGSVRVRCLRGGAIKTFSH